MNNNKEYIGMTVNERLYLSGNWDKFDEAIKLNDLETLKDIIVEIELPLEYLETVIKHYNLKKNR